MRRRKPDLLVVLVIVVSVGVVVSTKAEANDYGIINLQRNTGSLSGCQPPWFACMDGREPEGGQHNTKRVRPHHVLRILIERYVDRVVPSIRINHRAVAGRAVRKQSHDFRIRFNLVYKGTDYKFKYGQGELGVSTRGSARALGRGTIHGFLGFDLRW